MKFIYIAVLFILLTPGHGIANGFGPWKFGMSKLEVKSIKQHAPYSEVPITGGLETSNGVFEDLTVNVSFVFNGGKLRRIQIWVYEGKDFESSLESWLEVYDHIKEKYGSVKFKEIDFPEEPSRKDIEILFRNTMGNIPTIPRGTNMNIKFQMAPLKMPNDKIVFSNYIFDNRFGYYVFLYYDAP